MRAFAVGVGGLFLTSAAHAASVQIAPVAAPSAAVAAPLSIGGRVVSEGTEQAPNYRRQWPGTYFETSFKGDSAYLRIGPGEVAVNVSIDGAAPMPMVKPAEGFYLVSGLARGRHSVRVELISEDQRAPSAFGGFYLAPGAKTLRPPRRKRQMEFIGDSYTAGYGARSTGIVCTPEQVWSLSDTSVAAGPLVAKHYGADYQINAASGRGVVRNFGGAPGDTFLQTYPYTLFDKSIPYENPAWRPEVIVMFLGTNDFAMPLHDGERWTTREALQADFEAKYSAFVKDLRTRHPDALIVLWATTFGDGEIAAEVQKVAEQVKAGGDENLQFLLVKGLAFEGCNHHPSAADDRKIADALMELIDTRRARFSRR